VIYTDVGKFNVSMQISILNPKDPNQAFPPVGQALPDPNGLLAIGGCLSEQRLLAAYRQGIFPWYNPGEPILWWSPDPRMVLFPEDLKISRSLKKLFRKEKFQVSFDQAFEQVIAACAAPREGSSGTWISQEIKEAYLGLHQTGIAHSAEAWLGGDLVGGLYGVALGRVFFGESMFHRVTDASKVAFVKLAGHLQRCGYRLIDCQIRSSHLVSLGAREIPRNDFIELLDQYCSLSAERPAWCGH